MLLPVVLITTDEAKPHVLIEEMTGLEVRFEVAVGAVTVIEVTTPEERVGSRVRDHGPYADGV